MADVDFLFPRPIATLLPGLPAPDACSATGISGPACGSIGSGLVNAIATLSFDRLAGYARSKPRQLRNGSASIRRTGPRLESTERPALVPRQAHDLDRRSARSFLKSRRLRAEIGRA